MNWKNLFTASVIGAAVGTIESFCLVSVYNIAIGFSNTGVNYTPLQFVSSLQMALFCAAPPGLVSGLLGGIIAGLTCLNINIPVRTAIVRGALVGFVFGLAGAMVGYFISSTGG